jgi:hypothetical protein
MELTKQSVVFPMDYSFGKPICAAGHLRTRKHPSFTSTFGAVRFLGKAIEVSKRMCEHSELDNGDVIDRGKNDSGQACHLFPLSCNPSSLELRENRRPTYKSDGAKR